MAADPCIFFTADWHLGDPRLQLFPRPFTNPEHMADHLVAEHNAIVGPDDLVYVIGDALHSGGAAPPEEIKRFNGRKILLRGNHDVLPDQDYEPYFEKIVPEGEGVKLDIEDLSLYLVHYPHLAIPERFNLVGHIHASWKVQKNILNIGVDVHHFRPVSVADVRFMLGAITSYYDQDVWVADHPANQAHADRGKPGYYFA